MARASATGAAGSQPPLERSGLTWFARPLLATASAETATLVIRHPNATVTRIEVEALDWAMFIHAGEAFFANESAWWLLPYPNGFDSGRAVALSVECPGVETAIRGPLRSFLERADLIRADVADLPRALCGNRARHGVVLLDGRAAEGLRAQAHRKRVASVADLPTRP